MSIVRIHEFRASADHEGALQEFLRSVAGTVKAEPGCLACDLLVETGNDAHLLIVETWESVAAHEAAVTRIPRARLAEVGAMLAEQAKGRYYEKIEGGETPMTRNLIAKSAVSIKAPAPRVWDALVTPSAIKKYMFGADVETDWEEGSEIVWRGTYEGNQFEDKGRILQFDPERTLVYSHFSPLSGQPDTPANYHTVTIEVAEKGAATLVTLSQDNNDTEEGRAHSQKTWDNMLAGLKRFVEGRNRHRSTSTAEFRSSVRRSFRKPAR